MHFFYYLSTPYLCTLSFSATLTPVENKLLWIRKLSQKGHAMSGQLKPADNSTGIRVTKVVLEGSDETHTLAIGLYHDQPVAFFAQYNEDSGYWEPIPAPLVLVRKPAKLRSFREELALLGFVLIEVKNRSVP